MKKLTFGTLTSLMFIVFFETLLSMKRLAQMPYLRGSLATLIVSLVLTSASQAQLADTKIAFASNRDGNYEIYVMDADGKNQTRLTKNGLGWGSFVAAFNDRAGGPSWSPGGTKIAFSSKRDGNVEIYVMDADGKNPIRLTNNRARDMMPSWSPFPMAVSVKERAIATWGKVKVGK